VIEKLAGQNEISDRLGQMVSYDKLIEGVREVVVNATIPASQGKALPGFSVRLTPIRNRQSS